MALPYPEGEVFFNRSLLTIVPTPPPEPATDDAISDAITDATGITPAGTGMARWDWKQLHRSEVDRYPERRWLFDAADIKDFASHILIEYVCNKECDLGGHARSYRCSADSGGKTRYWASTFNVMFSREDDPAKVTRMVQIDNMSSADEYRDNSSGGPDKVVIVPVPVRAKEKHLYLDLVVPVRAIYFPLSQKADRAYPNLCTYIMIDFRLRKGVKMWKEFTSDTIQEAPSRTNLVYSTRANVYDGLTDSLADSLADEDPGPTIEDRRRKQAQPPSIPVDPERPWSGTHPDHFWQSFNYKTGLGLQPQNTLRVDIRGTYNYLMIPRHLRNPDKGLYCPTDPKDTLVKMYNRSLIDTRSGTKPTYEYRSFGPVLDYSRVIRQHFGVDVVWQPYEFQEEPRSLVSQIFQLGISTALELIPFVGPLVSTAFSTFMEAIYEPEEFKKNNILELNGDVVGAVCESAAGLLENLATSRKGSKIMKLTVKAIK